MPKTNPLLLIALIGACANPKDDPLEQAPEPIGPPLWSIVGTRSGCGGGFHLYRQGRQVQVQCFDYDGNFVIENRGTLTPEAATMLDAEIATADLDDTEPVNSGGCGALDSIGTETLWVGEQSISFEASCLIDGIVSLHEYVLVIEVELELCNPGEFHLLESIEPGCRILF